MAAIIQTIEKPTRARALDTSGNNNHGQIYSGRALEFDGVTDYLNAGTGVDLGTGDFTISAWVYLNAIGADENLFYKKQDSSNRWYFVINSSGKLVFWSRQGGSTKIEDGGSTTFIANTWYRVVVSADRDSFIKLYINGVLDGTGSGDTDTIDNTGALAIGLNGTAGGTYMDGMMSDAQIWDAAWTADDVLYDYNNPEQLALNRGGTSLTSSNLKLWYPMNDGHRGQQSYILDAANTGLSDSILSNGDFSNSTTGWTFVDCSGTVGTYFGESNVCQIEVDSANTVYMHQNDITIVGVTYKFSFDYYIPSTNTNLDAIQLRSDSSSSNKIIDSQTVADTWTSVYAYYTPASTSVDNILVYLNSTSTGGNDLTVGNSVYVKNIKIEPVNAKNHATTVFKGDELVTVAKDKNFDASNNWDVSNANWSIDGDSLDYDGSGGGSTALDQTYPAFVVGRTYEIKFGTSANDTIITIKDGDGSNTLVAETTYTSGTKTATFVAPATTDGLEFTAGGSSAAFAIDWINVKEIGTATGWTDADQQLDIPQTALQSYNQLAWFPGEDPGTDYDVDFGSGSELDDIWDGGGTASAWIYPVDAGAGSQGRIFNKQKWLFYVSSSGTKLSYTFDHGTTNATGETDNAVLTVGEWAHVVITYNDDSLGGGNEPKIYVNGDEVTVDETDSAGAYTTDASEVLLIGNKPDGSKTFHGAITEASLWSTVLTQAQVNELYNDGKALDATTHSNSSNLLGYWRNNGLSTWQDLTANDNDGTVNGLTETMLITAGADGSRDSQGFLMNRQRATNSLNNDYQENTETIGGIGHYVDTPGFNFHATVFSISCWIKSYTMGTNETIIDKYYNTNNQRALRLYTITSGELQMQVSDDGSSNESQKTTDANLVADTWYHIVVTYSSGTFTAYRNGTALSVDANFGTETSIDQNVAPLRIGMSQDTKGSFNGQIDDLAIYDNKVLSVTEAKRNYNAGKRSHR